MVVLYRHQMKKEREAPHHNQLEYNVIKKEKKTQQNRFVFESEHSFWSGSSNQLYF